MVKKMKNREILEAAENGIKLRDMITENLDAHFRNILKNLLYLGLDFKFFEDYVKRASLISTIKYKYGYITDQELTYLIEKGCSGNYSKTTLTVRGFHIFVWINEYNKERQQVLQDKRDSFDEDLDHRNYDVSNSPVGQAIIWKTNHVNLDEWETIPLQEIAEAINDKRNMREFADSYEIELINRA